MRFLRPIILSHAALGAAGLLSPIAGATFFLTGAPQVGNAGAAGAVSADGSIVVSNAIVNGVTRGGVWTAATGWVMLPAANGINPETRVRDVSDDGSVIVGQARTSFTFGTTTGFSDEAAVWRRLGDGSYTIQTLTPAPGGRFAGVLGFSGQVFAVSVDMEALAVSGDGRTVVGVGAANKASPSDPGSNPREGFLWDSTGGLRSIGTLSGGPIVGKENPPRTFSLVAGIDRNSRTVVGRSWSGLNASGGVITEAFRYDALTGTMVGLGDFVTPAVGSRADGISKDGVVVVGQGRGDSAGEQVAAFFTSDGGRVALGDLPGGSVNANALAANADGSVIVGRGTTERGSEAFLWTATGGLHRLEAVANLTAVELGNGWLEDATDLSDDGRTITGTYFVPDPAGQGQNLRTAYVLTLTAAELGLGPDLTALAAAAGLQIDISAALPAVRFHRDPSAGALYLLQGTDSLLTPFSDLVEYRPNGSGGFFRTVVSQGLPPNPNGSSDGQAMEVFPALPTTYFYRLRLRAP